MAKGRKTGGRRAGTPNKATRELKDMARPYGPKLIKALYGLAIGAESEAARVSAIKELFDRGWGRAAQAIQHTGAIGTYDLSNASDADLDALEAILGRLANTSAGESGEGEEGD